MTEILQNQIPDAFKEEVYMELKGHINSSYKMEPKALLIHIFENYAKIDYSTIFAKKYAFEEPLNMSRPIYV